MNSLLTGKVETAVGLWSFTGHSGDKPTNKTYRRLGKSVVIQGSVLCRKSRRESDSIVIGFWVGLAVFVIFMFFVLTLLTKTGAPHQDRNVDLSTKQRRTNSFAINYIMSRSDKAFSRPENEESRSLFHYYVNEVIQMERQQFVNKVPGPGNSDLTPRERGDRSDDSDDPMFCPSKFNLPNFVSIDQSSSLTEDDLLMCEQPIVLENKSDRLQEIHHISD
ncbi:melanocortin-2 receptor accessory protein 2-like isoform X6 [Chiloscyllium plagiosum]|uniref:melanocortin-2 receptor accessory protein 2-like isoform X6 n=1 Tax=Chiloscyllium plagiosum TaxID=36176 RepID=UPI001CB7DBBF|nr:melanocortin-2 receptor accessory protein 2-like isoform X6 [Chiloscyllium plagiosum]